MNYTNAVIYLLVGLAIITVIDTLGAIASRKLKFKYSYLIILSTAIYIYISYLTSAEYGLFPALLVNGLIGFYDGTIGFKLSILLNANTGLDKQKSMEHLNERTALFMIIMASIFAIIGFVISKI